MLIERKGAGSRMVIRGTIVDYTGKNLSILIPSSEKQQTYLTSEVVSVETPQTEPHIRGLMEFSRRSYKKAREEFEKALDQETRTWVRREILAMLARCAMIEGDYITAAARSLVLARSDPSTRHFNLIPLAWSGTTIDVRLKNSARNWLLEGTTEVERLLGASLLLEDREHGRRAELELDTLATSTETNIHLLARAQLWRLKLRNQKLIRSELDRWEFHIANMPESLRGGPYYLLAKAHLQRREYERAATALLWLPMVYDHDHYLAARACLEGADALFDAGHHNPAITLYREVTLRFSNTPSAPVATNILKAMEKKEQQQQETN